MSTMFTENEQRLLDKTVRVREQLIDALTKNDMPTKTNDVLSLVSAIESLDKSIFTKAKLKIEDDSSKNNEETRNLMRELMLNLHKKSNVISIGVNEVVLPDSVIYEITDEELTKYVDNVSIQDFAT